MGGCAITSVAPIDRAGPSALTHGCLAAATPARCCPAAPAPCCSLRLSPTPLPSPRRESWSPIHTRALVEVLRRLFPPSQPSIGIDPTARIGAGTRLGADVSIGPFVVLGRDVRLGDRCVLGEGVSVGDGVTIGDDCRMDARVVCYAGAPSGGECW